jgi:hypothetical protein
MTQYLGRLLLAITGIYLILVSFIVPPAFAQVSYPPPFSIYDSFKGYSF